MGPENLAPSQSAAVSTPAFVTSTQTNDHSNPQQGTGVTKNTMRGNQDLGAQNNSNRKALSPKSNVTPQPNHTEDKRKLFVGGLPTDITDPEFRFFFSQFGELHESAVMFDRVTRRSRGFGFVTYVNPAVAQSLLQMGNHGDGIGRLVMRGKMCEIKPAAPRGQAPSRGGKTHRNNRNGPRNQHQGQPNQVPFFGHNEQFPVLYQNDGYNQPFPQGIYSAVPGYVPPVFHLPVLHASHSQPHSLQNGSIPLGPDRNLSESVLVGSPYFFGSSLPAHPSERFSSQSAFAPTPQISDHYQQGYGFAPYFPDHNQSALPVMDSSNVMEPVETSTATKDESNDEVVIEVVKD